MMSHWNRNLYGRKRRQNEEESQLTLEQLRSMVAKRPSDLSDASTTCSFQTAATLAGLPARPSTPTRKGRRRGPLHASPEPLLAGGEGPQRKPAAAAVDAEAESSAAAAELVPFESIIQGEITGDHVRQILSMRVSNDLGVKEEDIGGLTEVKSLIKRKVIAPLRRPDLHVGLYQAARGVLFFGPPGTGKTTLAKWIATETEANFLNVTSSSLISKFQGETETLVKTLFLVAACLQPCIVFLDEIDSLVGRRREKEEDSTLRMKNQLLQAMDGLGATPAACGSGSATVIVIAATNRPDAVDPAALRRLPKRVYVPLPDFEARVQQLAHTLRRHAQALGQSAGTVSESGLRAVAARLEGFNGSDLTALCSTAAELVYEETLAACGGSYDFVQTPSQFRVPTPNDLLRALPLVNPSGKATTEIDYLEWSKRLGCL